MFETPPAEAAKWINSPEAKSGKYDGKAPAIFCSSWRNFGFQ